MYADAGLFLVPVLYANRAPWVVAAAQFLESLARGTGRVSTSTLTWDEVVYVVRRFLGPEDSTTKGGELLAFPNPSWLRVDLAVLRRGALPVSKLLDAPPGCDPRRGRVGGGRERDSLRGPGL